MNFQDILNKHALLTANYLETSFSDNTDAPTHLYEAMKYAVLNGGKRFRPFLVIECAKLFNIPTEQALPTAAALECIHCYSLVHDDLPSMDDDDIRRGKPTVHIAFDEATAILAGDGLLTYAFELLSRPAPNIKPENQILLIRKMAEASGWNGMVGGQARDLEAETRNDLNLEDVSRIQSMKTGALIRFACEAGGLIGNANPEQLNALITYGDKLGRVFQLADDLLDIEGDPELVGKAIEKDTDAGKATFVSLMGIKEAKAELDKLTTEAIDCLKIFDQKADSLIDAAWFAAKRNH